MPVTPAPTPTGNRLLDRLPPGDRDPLLKAAETLAMRRGQEICHEGRAAPYVYFPIEGACSAVVTVEEGMRIEVGSVGNEGMVGLPVFLGTNVSPVTEVWKISGRTLRLVQGALRRSAAPGTALARLLSCYAAFSLREARQLAACNSVHSVEERACRWMLTTLDRMSGDEFHLTHECLAEMLAVRRQSISIVAATLQKAGFVAYSRGRVRVLNRAGLEEASCGCYRTIKEIYERVMGAEC